MASRFKPMAGWVFMRHPGTRLSLTSGNGHSQPPAPYRAAQLPPDTLKFLTLSLKHQWKCYRKQLRACQRRFSERSVHDLRVSARRLLSLLDLLAPFLSVGRFKSAQCALKAHLDTFDELRDLQVQLPAARKFRKQFPAAACFARFLKKREARVRRSTCRTARRLRCKPLGKLMRVAREEAKAWVGQPGSRQPNPMLVDTIARAFALTRARQERITPEDAHSIHRTRVAFKRFRYVIECLKDQLPWANKALLSKMHGYQTLMGDIQDADVLLRAFRKFRGKGQLDPRSSRQFEQALEERRQRLIRKYLAVADQLCAFWPAASAGTGGKRVALTANNRPQPTRGPRVVYRKDRRR